MNKLLCFWAPLPIPESQWLIVVHRAPLRSLKSKNSPLTHTHTLHTHMLVPHPLNPPAHAHKHTLLSTPIPKPIMLTSLKNICSNGLAVKPFPVCYGPHISRFLHTGTQRAVYVHQGAIFTLTMGDRHGARGEHWEWRLFSGMSDWKHEHTRADTQSGNVQMWTQMHTIHIHTDTLTFTAECSQSSWNVNRLPSKVFTEELLMHHGISTTRPHFIIWTVLGRLRHLLSSQYE